MSVHLPIDRHTAQPLTRTRPRPFVAPWMLALLAILAATLVLRFGQFGNAIAGLDEQFYLLVGDRMWAGELPYVDIWDRKPIGLFVLFAAIRVLPGDGVLAAQLVACAAAAGTAWLVAVMAKRWVGWLPATLAGIFYLAGLNELWGGTTQTPVFYDLPITASGLLVLRTVTVRSPADRLRVSMVAMLLAGIAVQIKTNAVFEGALFGGWVVWATWRDGGRPIRTIACLAVAGAVPTLAAMIGYAAIGHFDAWWQANILSVIAKGRPSNGVAIDTLWETVILTAPIVVLALVGLWARTKRFVRWDRNTIFLASWIAVTIVDFAAIGGYFPHYAVPFLLACSPLIASAFALPWVGPGAFFLAMCWPSFHAAWLNPRFSAKERGYADQVVSALPADVRTRCLFVFEGPVIYYHLSHACRVTRFAFTAHLSSITESRALGVDAVAELKAAMARRPGTVLTVAHSMWRDRNATTARVLDRELARQYRVAAILPYRLNPRDGELVMWRLRDR